MQNFGKLDLEAFVPDLAALTTGLAPDFGKIDMAALMPDMTVLAPCLGPDFGKLDMAALMPDMTALAPDVAALTTALAPDFGKLDLEALAPDVAALTTALAPDFGKLDLTGLMPDTITLAPDFGKLDLTALMPDMTALAADLMPNLGVIDAAALMPDMTALAPGLPSDFGPRAAPSLGSDVARIVRHLSDADGNHEELVTYLLWAVAGIETTRSGPQLGAFVSALIAVLEEVVCNRASGTGKKTLHDASKHLMRCGAVSSEVDSELQSLYQVRNRTRGIGHGVGPIAWDEATRLQNRVVGVLDHLVTKWFPSSDP